APEYLEVVHVRRKALERSELVEDRRTDDHRDLEVLALRGRLLSVDTGTMRRAGHVEPALVLGAKHGPVEPPVVDARVRVLRDHEVVVGVRLPVALVM